MNALELACLAIVGAYVALRVARLAAPERLAFGARMIALALASFAGEDTIIRAYHTYAYSSAWSIRVDQVPLVVVLVWPVVVDSARALAKVLIFREGRSAIGVAALGALVVLADAALIEPIAVRAGLWAWTDPGIFGVPFVGIFGWALFTFAAVWILERTRHAVLVIAIAPPATHALVLASWWIVFRWIQGPAPDVAGPIAAWTVALVIAALLARSSPTRSPALRSILAARAPGALFFFVLLGVHARGAAPLLLLYAIAFAPPYLVLLVQVFGITLQNGNRKSLGKSV